MSSLVLGACAAALLWFSSAAMQACREAAQVFFTGVMPGLFPMMVISRLLPQPHRKGAAVQTVLFGWMSGSPAAAQRVMASGAEGKALEKLLCAAGVMSPLFLTGTLGAWVGSREAGWKMLLAHWLGAALTALLWRGESRGGSQQERMPASTLVSAVSQSMTSLLAVCGAMMLFSVLAGVLQELLPLPAPVFAVLHAMLEIGSGAKAVIDAFPQSPCALLCALCSFGGMSLWLQNLLFVGTAIRPVKLLLMRALHGAVSYGLYSLISFL